MNSGESERKSIYIVLNPVAGRSSAADLRQAIDTRLSSGEQVCDVYETTGKEDIAKLAHQAAERGSTMVVAAGGDGTVTGVVKGLINSKVPLGIIPVGTGNGLARALGIPLDPKGAIDLLAGRHTEIDLDAMGVGDDVFILNVSAGISARAMDETPTQDKRRFGILAYAWTIVKQLFGYGPRRYVLDIDNHQVNIRATEVLISNGALLREPPFPLGPRKLFNDGQFDIYIITAQSIVDYIRILWNFMLFRGKGKSDLRHMIAKDTVRIDTIRRPQPVQADGEVIGQTPVEVKLIRSAIRVIVPEIPPGEK